MEEKILVKFYESEAAKQINYLKVSLTDLQTIFNEVTKIIKGKDPVTIEELGNMIIPDIYSIPPKRPKPNEGYIIEFVRSRIAEDFKGLPIKKEMIEIPAIDGIVDTILRGNSHLPGFIYNGSFEIQKGKVVIRDGVEESIIESFKVYAESPDQIKRFESVQKLADAMNEVGSYLSINPAFGVKLFIQGQLEYMLEYGEDGNVIPTDYFVKTGNAPFKEREFDVVIPNPQQGAIGGTQTASNKFIKDLLAGSY
ncbi:hypothetical protein KCV26_11770 [Petrimonas sulfuriphila]|uniref:hypothetical protein n=1 Tax=Petrimonas sulfuriphila TaxID=285070 RepID=UPI00325158A0